MLSGIGANAIAIVAVIRRDIRRASSYRAGVVLAGVSGIFTMLTFYYVSRLVIVEPFDSPDAYFAFVVVGLLALQIANGVLSIPLFLLSQELMSGTFERLVVSPLGARTSLVGTMVFPLASSVVAGTASVAFAAIVFGIHLELPDALLAIPAAGLIGLAFAPLGLFLLAGVLVVKQIATAAGWIVTVLSLLAGLYFPVALLPDWIQWGADVQPLTPAVDLMRHLIVGTDIPDSPWLNALRLVAFAVVLLPIAWWLLGRAVDRSRRRGTIIEY